MSEIASLEPRLVWEQFDAITRVPRPSKKEEKIREYLVRFAADHGIECHTDLSLIHIFCRWQYGWDGSWLGKHGEIERVVRLLVGGLFVEVAGLLVADPVEEEPASDKQEQPPAGGEHERGIAFASVVVAVVESEDGLPDPFRRLAVLRAQFVKIGDVVVEELLVGNLSVECHDARKDVYKRQVCA